MQVPWTHVSSSSYDRRLHTPPRTPATPTDTASGPARAKPAPLAAALYMRRRIHVSYEEEDTLLRLQLRFHGCKLPSAARLSSLHCTFRFFRTVNNDHSIAGWHRASQSMCEPYTGTYSTVAHSRPSVCVYNGVCVPVSTLCVCRLASTACIYFCI